LVSRIKALQDVQPAKPDPDEDPQLLAPL
jgi:hypothetical protein